MFWIPKLFRFNPLFPRRDFSILNSFGIKNATEQMDVNKRFLSHSKIRVTSFFLGKVCMHAKFSSKRKLAALAFPPYFLKANLEKT